MSYYDQGSKTRDLGGGVKAPAQNRGNQDLIKEAGGETCGIVGDKGIGKDGLPIKPYAPRVRP